METWLKKIPLVLESENVKQIKKGYSSDIKYIIDEKFLIRIFKNESERRRREEFNTIKQLGNYSEYVPKAITYQMEEDFSYMVLSYFAGEDGESALSSLTKNAQYDAGFRAGNELYKLHQYKDPNVNLDWYSHKKEKTKRYFQELEQLKIDKKLKTLCLDYFIKNESLMKRRPTTFQHDDFHPANIIIENGKFAGIIDFQRMDWGDPIHDLHKLGFFSSPISIPFTQGIVDGYHLHTKLSTDFWELYTLYSVIHLVSSLVWGTKRGMQEKMMMYAMNVLKDHDNFTRIIPRWYQT